jgi:hypothetical protein
MPIDLSRRAGQYVGVSLDTTRRIKGHTIRIVVYGAYDAMGLIGSQHNGVAVLLDDPSHKQVLVDGMAQAPSGWYAPSKDQITLFNTLETMPVGKFIRAITTHPRSRFSSFPPGA